MSIGRIEATDLGVSSADQRAEQSLVTQEQLKVSNVARAVLEAPPRLILNRTIYPPSPDFGFTPKQMWDIRNIYRQTQQDPNIFIHRDKKTNLVTVTFKGISTQYDFPHKLYFELKDNHISKIYAKHKFKKVGEGGQQAVFLAYEFFSAQYYVHKRISNDSSFEEEFLKKAQSLPNKQGLFLPDTLILTGNKHKMFIPKAIPLSDQSIKDPVHIKNIMEDLLVGLNTMHEMTFDTCTVDPFFGAITNHSVQLTFKTPKVSHQDIKSDNILLQKDSERGFKAGFIDFGLICPFDLARAKENFIVGTPLYRSSNKFRQKEIVDYSKGELLKSYKKLIKIKEQPQTAAIKPILEEQEKIFKSELGRYQEILNDYCNIYAQKEDIWALGITFLEILSAGKSVTLECFEAEFMKQGGNVRPVDNFIKNINQIQMNQSIDKFFSDHIDPILNPNDKMKKLIKGMLTIEYSDRFNAKKALEAFKDVFSSPV